ncbi:peptidylprolyl isomerase [Sphingomonas japonica]|uniref:Peptidyl-prolyl cis-trans isomerase n=1 Tax=Sphingomonas japonica TaxID=511662 RepID=A0ABX0U0H4_9SPHN|nr:peptidylprolyl isomerase [Sphingomonas japonica]NIJ23211.1 peptidylprolyl isomerase [Sphingomonas japonica]
MRLIVALFALLGMTLALPAQAQVIDVKVKGRATPPSTTDKENLWLLDLSTGGRVTIWLRPDVAPKMVERIKTLTRRKFYDGVLFHRVIDGFMAQSGDPKGDGTGGSDLPDLEKEFNYLPHVRGAVSAARPGAPQDATPEQKAEAENGANSQFFIMFQPLLRLDKQYTVFGRVLDGMQYVDSIPRGEPPAQPARILHAYIAADNPPPYQPGPATLPAGEAPVTLPGTEPAAATAPAPAE